MSDLNLNLKYKSAEDFNPEDKGHQIKGWAAVIEAGMTVGNVDGYLIDEAGEVDYVTIMLNNDFRQGTDAEIILFPEEEIEIHDRKNEILLEAITPEFLALYPRYTPGDQLTIEMEKRMRQFFTGGTTRGTHLGSVIKRGRRTTWRHGPLSTDRGIG